ncbi:hypothetical protein T11_3286, partial [Trichinella zimbabwensis]
LRKDFSTPPTPKKDRVTVPCLVFTVADLITPSSLGWISIILPIGHLIHVVLGSDVLLFPSFPQLGSQALLILPSPYQVVHSTWGVITPVDSGAHTWAGVNAASPAMSSPMNTSGRSLMRASISHKTVWSSSYLRRAPRIVFRSALLIERMSLSQ